MTVKQEFDSADMAYEELVNRPKKIFARMNLQYNHHGNPFTNARRAQQSSTELGEFLEKHIPSLKLKCTTK